MMSALSRRSSGTEGWSHGQAQPFIRSTLEVLRLGSWNPLARDTFQEAPRYRFLKVVRGGKVQPEVVETYLTNSRTPHLLELDLRAQIAAANVAKERLALLPSMALKSSRM